LDISKAFDSINWPFMLEVMQALGFSVKWRDWIAALLGSASSKVLVNGQPTEGIRHARGLRQGDPLSPLLFILAIDPLQRIIEVAAQKGILEPILQRQQGYDARYMRMTLPSFPSHPQWSWNDCSRF
jgi:hypothetical protein